ncbi:MAG TPA: glucose-6-phosphate dehydrogenase assembly protein OpcA, partial [Polyangia bacterium]|nr:glucose-6-phosphate dehydrogenase assembly protein OpcA [Polyangia bacterium]
MSTPGQDDKGGGADRHADFERGDAIEVPVGRIESELAALWRHAAQASGAGGGKPKAVTRACLWNLVIRVPDAEHFPAIKRLVDELAQRLPARTIVTRPEAQSPDGLRAWVEANWRRPEGAGTASGSDEVTLWAGGAHVERLSSLVRALLHPDAPTAMYWPGALPDKLTRHARDFIHEADRLIVDTRKLVDERGLGQLCRIGEADPDLELADLSWLGISPLRGVLAALFDPPRDPTQLQHIDRVKVTSNIQGTQARGLLALGWLVSRLGWRKPRRLPDSKCLRAWQLQRSDGKAVRLELATATGGATHGVAGLELFAGEPAGDDNSWSLTRDDC